MEMDRTQRQLGTLNKARNLRHWFLTYCILHPTAAEHLQIWDFTTCQIAQ